LTHASTRVLHKPAHAPTSGASFLPGPDRFHEIKHDGYRLIVQREGKRVRLFTRNGNDWTDRYPLIVEAALRLLKTSRCSRGEKQAGFGPRPL
jgi:bifunctional non-homologous end joining protein LigD